MKTTNEIDKRGIIPLVAFVFGLIITPLSAQSTSTGSIGGRIQDSTTGDYLNNARVAIEGRNITTLSNVFGEYHLPNAPVGSVTLTVFYSGLPLQRATVDVNAGQRTVQDFDLKSGAGSGTVVLGAVSVTANRDMSQAAIATHEQRFAPNMKSVLAADTFGDQSEGNVAEFLKFMPSISVGYVDQDARTVALRGLPSYTTIIASDGNQLASATSSATRNFEFERTSINNIARIEFNKTLLPDMPAEGIGGTINLITKSAFERSRPEFTYRGYFNFNTSALTLGKKYGPRDKADYLVRPGFDFNYIKPINKNLGITIGGAMSGKFNPQLYATHFWTLNPDPETGVENPYIRQFSVNDSPKITNRTSGRVSLDWRFAPHDVLRLRFSEDYYDAYWNGARLRYLTGTNPVEFSRNHSQGRPGAGTMTRGSSGLHKSGTTWTPDFNYTHDGPTWKFEVRGAYSHASYHGRTHDDGRFAGFNMNMGFLNSAGTYDSPTVRLDKNGDYTGVITATNPAGEVVDHRDLNNYYLSNASTNWADAVDVKSTLAAYAKRELDLAVPVTIKAGGDVRRSIRDSRSRSGSYTFVGPDGKAGTGDDAIASFNYDLVGVNNIKKPAGVGYYDAGDPFKLWGFYLEHPDWWTTNPSAEFANLVANSHYVNETITSGFVRVDTSLWQGRLKLVGGVRFQGYGVDAESGVVDELGRYLHDEQGELVLDPATGNPVLVGGSALEITGRTNIERGVLTTGNTKGFYPSLNTAFRVTDRLQLRLSFADSINYPNLNEVASVTRVSDFTSNPRRVTVNSPLKPWTAHNYDVDLEYYTDSGGSFVFSVYRKDISNFINSTRYDAGTPEAAEALEKYGYGQLAPLGFEIIEKFNGGEATLDGWEFEFRQSLDPYVPHWARGFTVFFNTAYKAAPTGISASNLSAQSQRLFNWGTTIRRGRFGANLRWNHVPEPKRRVPSTSHLMSVTKLDVDVSYQIRRGLSVFASATNLTSVANERYTYTPNTPEYARQSQFAYYGVQCIAGIKGQF